MVQGLGFGGGGLLSLGSECSGRLRGLVGPLGFMRLLGLGV